MHKILVADDKVVITTQLVECLTSMRYEFVGRAYSGESAVEKARLLRPDLILMDIAIPGKIDGINAAETIKAELDIPVIFLIDYADDKFVERAKNAAPFGYILKPFQEYEIKAAIEVALYRKESERRLRESEEQLKSEIAERKQVEEVLRKEKKVLENVIATVPDSLLILDKDLRIKSANRAFYESFQTEPEKAIGRNISEIVGDNDGKLSSELAKLFGTEDILENFELHCQSENTDERIFNIRAREIMVAEELIVIGDITNRKWVEEETKASLREKDVLLKEIHHRVKNNLQIISSLLDMHSMRTYDQQTIDFLRDARAKIQAMALIHSQLYQSDRFTQIDMGCYIRELIDYLSRVYANRNKLITPIIEHTDVYLTITQAIPCALVLHEMVSNAFKHAFTGRQKGVIDISMQKSADDKVFIRVEDDGIGISKEIDIYRTDSMGLKLVRNLVQEQLKGNIQINRDNGTEVFIEFKLLKWEVEHA
jgi:PAS domain S-box-containing protein